MKLWFGLMAAMAASSATAAERGFPVGAFDRVALTGSPDVEVRVGRQPSVRATGTNGQLDRLQITTVDGQLRIRLRPTSFTMNLGIVRRNLRVLVTVPRLTAASVDGSGSITVDGARGPAFTGAVDGSGDLTLNGIDAQRVALSLDGSGSIRAAGQARSAALSVRGSGDVDTRALRTAEVTTQLRGSGDLAAHASRVATNRLNGSGDIRITGGARCTDATSGSGSVRCL